MPKVIYKSDIDLSVLKPNFLKIEIQIRFLVLKWSLSALIAGRHLFNILKELINSNFHNPPVCTEHVSDLQAPLTLSVITNSDHWNHIYKFFLNWKNLMPWNGSLRFTYHINPMLVFISTSVNNWTEFRQSLNHTQYCREYIPLHTLTYILWTIMGYCHFKSLLVTNLNTSGLCINCLTGIILVNLHYKPLSYR